jgi:hypothetical protein
MRGIVVPAGKHTVTMNYRPWTIQLGAALAALSLLAVAGLAYWDRARSADHREGASLA